MGITYQLLFWIHMVSLALGGVATFGILVVGSKVGAATAEIRPLLFSIAGVMSNVGRTGLALLIITGPIMYGLAWSTGGAPNMTAFIAKMVLVVVLIVLVIVAGLNAKRAQGGDRAAAQRAPLLGMSAAVTFVLIMLCAALAFK
jgi:hypothetical protein